MNEVIRPALADGLVVVSDRYLDSSLAYQGAARGLGVKEVERVNGFATRGLKPDLTVLLELDLAAAAARGAEDDRFEREGAELQRSVAGAYVELAAASPQRWRRIDAGREPQAVHAEVLAAVRGRSRRPGATLARERREQRRRRHRGPSPGADDVVGRPGRPAVARLPLPRARRRGQAQAARASPPSCWPRARPTPATRATVRWPARTPTSPGCAPPART